MFNVCHSCGAYHADKAVDPNGPHAVCPACGHRHPFLRLPLFIICGPSGAGKTAVLQRLLGRLGDVVLLEGDLLWRPELDQPQDGYRDFFETWLRLCKNIAQSGRPGVLFNAGAIPLNVEPCIERRYFSAVHYLGLVCDDEVLAARLRARPGWRGSGEPAFVEAQIGFNRWFKEKAAGMEPPIALLDTTTAPLDETARQVARWVQAKVVRPAP